MDKELKQMGKVAKAHLLLDKLEDFVKAVIAKEDDPMFTTYYDDYYMAYDALQEFLVRFIDLRIEK